MPGLISNICGFSITLICAGMGGSRFEAVGLRGAGNNSVLSVVVKFGDMSLSFAGKREGIGKREDDRFED